MSALTPSPKTCAAYLALPLAAREALRDVACDGTWAQRDSGGLLSTWKGGADNCVRPMPVDSLAFIPASEAEVLRIWAVAECCPVEMF